MAAQRVECTFENSVIEAIRALLPREDWGDNHQVLHTYLMVITKNAFQKENTVRFSDDGRLAVINTGLATVAGIPLFGIFVQEELPGAKFILICCVPEAVARRLVPDGVCPPKVTFGDACFEADLDIEIDVRRILRCNNPMDRICSVYPEFRGMSRRDQEAMLEAAITTAVENARSNPGLVVRQYYQGKSEPVGKIEFLLPAYLNNNPNLLVVFPVEKQLVSRSGAAAPPETPDVECCYRGETVFPPEEVYPYARVISPVRSAWLVCRRPTPPEEHPVTVEVAGADADVMRGEPVQCRRAAAAAGEGRLRPAPLPASSSRIG